MASTSVLARPLVLRADITQHHGVTEEPFEEVPAGEAALQSLASALVRQRWSAAPQVREQVVVRGQVAARVVELVRLVGILRIQRQFDLHPFTAEA